MYATTRAQAEKRYKIALDHYIKAEFDRAFKIEFHIISYGREAAMFAQYGYFERVEIAIERTKIELSKGW